MDAQAPVQLVFFGEVLAGFRQEDVQHSLAALLKLDPARAAALFSGARVVLKRELPAAQAERYVAHLASLGARVHVEALGTPAASAALLHPQPRDTLPPGEPLTAAAQPFAPRAEAPAAEAIGLAGLTQPRAPAADRSSPPAEGARPADEKAQGAEATFGTGMAERGRASDPHAATAPSAAWAPPAAAAAPGTARLPSGAGPDPADGAAGLSLEGAQEQIVCPTCGERQSKRILCRNCATDMPMGIAAKEEAEQMAREQRLAASRGGRGEGAWPGDEPGELPASDAAADAPPLLGMGFSGRMGRLQYATAGFAVLAACLFAGALAMKLMMSSPVALGVLVLVGLVLVFAYSLRVMVLRLHDVNLSGWWAVLFLLPSFAAKASPLLSLLTTVASLALMAWPGSRGDNDHGPRPRSGSWKALIATVLLLVLGTALVVNSMRHASDALNGLARMRGAQAGADMERSLEQAMVQAVIPPSARSAYERDYRDGADHKAFAVSSGGSWGWWTGAPSMRQAVERALAECDRRREAYSAQCAVVNVDGQWVGQER